MKNYLTVLCFLFNSIVAFSQNQSSTSIPRPKLVIGLMIDQMRWDYLYRYYDRYSQNGFKRILREGFSCENTFIPFAQTLTAAGHTCVYTGSVPAIHGIMGNDWYDKKLGKIVYCTDDDSVKTIGGDPRSEPMSPKNLWTTTICDELRLATNFQSKVIGIAIKDRGGILPAGHSANAAYWYDGFSGNWVTSTYYMPQLPAWANTFNNKKYVDSFYAKDWNTLYPINTYKQSDKDNVDYEGKFSHEKAPVFPHDLSSKMGKDYGLIRSTPYGNTFTLNFARTALKAESLGKDAITDFLAVSLSSPDYIGHQFGPNSIEVEDNYLRLDKDIADFLAFLDREVGKGQYLFFLTADHAVAHNPYFLSANKIPYKTIGWPSAELSRKVEAKFKVKQVIKSSANYHLYLNDSSISASGANKAEIKRFMIDSINTMNDYLMAVDAENISDANLPAEIKELFINGYNTKLGGDIILITKPGLFSGGRTGTTHGSIYPYDSHIPLLWMGWGIKAGKLNKEVHMTDIAPTIAALLRIQMPSGSIGKVITEVMK